MEASPGRILPVVDDRDTGGYWRAAAGGRIVVGSCTQCASLLHLPRPYCHVCGSADVGWTETSGTGTLYSWTLVEHQVHPLFPVPYAVLLVELDDAPGVRLVARLPGRPDLEFGMPMVARFEQLDDTTVLPYWEPAEASVPT